MNVHSQAITPGYYLAGGTKEIGQNFFLMKNHFVCDGWSLLVVRKTVLVFYIFDHFTNFVLL